MNNQSFLAYSTIIAELFRCTNQYYAMQIEFAEARMEGFEYMARIESKERWYLGDCICQYILKNGKKPLLSAQPAPNQGIPSAGDALKIGMEHEQLIIKAVNSGLVTVRDNDPGEIDFMCDLKEKCMKEHHEISGFLAKLALPGNSPWSMDQYLWKKYTDSHG